MRTCSGGGCGVWNCIKGGEIRDGCVKGEIGNGN
jgi:hypothetical protein